MLTAEAAVTDEPFATTPILLATIRAAKRGDSGAFEELMIATERRAAVVAWRVLGDAEEVKEALQETFFRVYRHLAKYDEQHDFFAWLYRITVNVCRDLARRNRQDRVLRPLEDASHVGTAPRSNDDVALLGRAIDSLPERERLAIILRELDELTTDEVAAILGNSPATVRVQIRNALTKLRAFFGVPQ
jgi:RNA polymerase sigma-70 factor (ECF subfamily)